jgi:hypothetical protein
VPETLGVFEAVVLIVVNNYIMVETVRANVVANQYGLKPLHFTDVLVKESYTYSLEINNSDRDHYLIIKEIYSTEEFLQLKWPNGAILDN